MTDSMAILERDLQILEQMVAEVAAYLRSDAPGWTLAVPDMPPLTLGGLLMRRERLTTLQGRLDESLAARLDAGIAAFEAALVENVVRVERRATQELRARLSEWSGYLRTAGSRAVSEPGYYATVVDTRVVVTATLDFLAEAPYQVDARICAEVDQLDRHLRSRWQDGPFLWDPIWQPAYPPDRYWWLYGHPRAT